MATPRIAHQADTNTIAPPLSPRFKADQMGQWSKILLPLANELPQEVFETLLAEANDQERRKDLVLSMVEFYSENEKITELFDYIIKREMVSHLEDPERIFSSGSCFDIIIKEFLKNDLDVLLDDIVTFVIAKMKKDKLKFSNEPKKINKSVKKIAKLLEQIMQQFTTSKNFTAPSLCFLRELQKAVKYEFPKLNDYAIDQIFLELITGKLSSFGDVKGASEKETLEVICTILKWFIHKEDTDYSTDLKSKVAESIKLVEHWKSTLISNEFEKEELVIQWKITSDEFLFELIRCEKLIREKADPYTQRLLDIHFNDEIGYRKGFKSFEMEIKRLQVGEMNNAVGIMLAMSTINMRIKDVKEEIRYLEERLEIRDDRDDDHANGILSPRYRGERGGCASNTEHSCVTTAF
ncbi:hypothetical protein EIN_372280 [Entamoeba invadens IP1]|uniref:Uncharacterized protein n=1 Tax=Entamoeba invadens IP1 TaxID=370355 RepID=A0A0A1UC37_ENTIV|nr:hypothetical protein EIN_372280 [Entamoeba invadens IP1]ELP92806.1 hypothetical protein EIN_372280 [Entamoeba invadens IP1]|eukprot:XP_004259577.1 hypothetical protein EIN_372280 [Entamoeba invadens IP1]